MLDKGHAALANTLKLERQGLHWITALPSHQASPQLHERTLDELSALGPQPMQHTYVTTKS